MPRYDLDQGGEPRQPRIVNTPTPAAPSGGYDFRNDMDTGGYGGFSRNERTFNDPAPAPTRPTAPASPIHGGLTPTSPFAGNGTPRTYRGADGSMWTDDPNPNSVTGFVPLGGAQGGPQNGDYRTWFMNLVNGRPPTPQELTALGPELEKYGIKLAPNAKGVNGKIRLPNGEVIDVIEAADAGGKAWQWLDNAWYQQNGGGGRANYGSPNPFDDPATKSYIDLLNSRINALNTPQQNPELDKLFGYLNQYFQQLQQPVYTDAQRNVLQTQAIDPLERQRQARKQQVVQQLAARGLSPSDGPAIQALQNVDREFDQMRTQLQSQFATNEIGLGQQQQRQAVDIGSLAAQMRNGQFQQEEARAGQGLGYARQIPDLAQQRLQTAIALLNGNSINPLSALQTLNSFNTTDRYNQQADSQYWGGLMAELARIFGL